MIMQDDYLFGKAGADAMREKADHVIGIMESRLLGLGAGWDLVTTVEVYTVFLLEGLLEDAVMPEDRGRRRVTGCAGAEHAPPSVASTSRWTCAASGPKSRSRTSARPTPRSKGIRCEPQNLAASVSATSGGET